MKRSPGPYTADLALIRAARRPDSLFWVVCLRELISQLGLTCGETIAGFDLDRDRMAFVRHLVDIGCQLSRPGEWWPDSPRGGRWLLGPTR